MLEKSYKEVLDSNGTSTIVLKNLVFGVASTTTIDIRSATASILEGSSILANIGPPDIVQGASTLAVDTFTVVGTNDTVAKGCAGLEQEDSISITSLSLVIAGRSYAKLVY